MLRIVNLSTYNHDYKIYVEAYYEPAQNGGRYDESWDEHYSIDSLYLKNSSGRLVDCTKFLRIIFGESFKYFEYKFYFSISEQLLDQDENTKGEYEYEQKLNAN